MSRDEKQRKEGQAFGDPPSLVVRRMGWPCRDPGDLQQGPGRPIHPRGKVLTRAAIMLAKKVFSFNRLLSEFS